MSIFKKLKPSEYSEDRKRAIKEAKEYKIEKNILHHPNVICSSLHYKLICPKCNQKVYTEKPALFKAVEKAGSIENFFEKYICIECRRKKYENK